MFARVEVPLGQRQRLLIPRGAAVHRGQLTGLYLLDRDNIARFRLIRLGRSFGDQVEVLSGLRPGEWYVAKPSPGIHDGVRVEVGT
jgi:multidrug efflux pump subunit AcrA (membrane-fusion protein)